MSKKVNHISYLTKQSYLRDKATMQDEFGRSVISVKDSQEVYINDIPLNFSDFYENIIEAPQALPSDNAQPIGTVAFVADGSIWKRVASGGDSPNDTQNWKRIAQIHSGTDGAYGKPFRFAIVANSKEDLDSKLGNASQGDFAIVAGTLDTSNEEYGKVYTHNGTNWEFIVDMSIKGYDGLKGDAGTKIKIVTELQDRVTADLRPDDLYITPSGELRRVVTTGRALSDPKGMIIRGTLIKKTNQPIQDGLQIGDFYIDDKGDFYKLDSLTTTEGASPLFSLKGKNGVRGSLIHSVENESGINTIVDSKKGDLILDRNTRNLYQFTQENSNDVELLFNLSGGSSGSEASIVWEERD